MQCRGAEGESRARRKLLHVLVVMLLGALGGPAACIDFAGCKSDSDCGKGFACVGLLGGTCERACTLNDDCPSADFCADMEWFSSPHCEKGCRADGQCDKDLVCVAGSCTPGCHTDDQCPVDMFCEQPGFTLGPEAGGCKPGCRADAQCGGGKSCMCNACVASGCRSNDECGAGAFCPMESTSVFSCTPRSCAPLPADLTCGTGVCSARAVTVSLGSLTVASVALPPCCLSDAQGTCGIDVSSLSKSIAVTCQAPSSGSIDPACPAVAGSSGNFSGCRRADGTCGFDTDSAGSDLCLLAE